MKTLKKGRPIFDDNRGSWLPKQTRTFKNAFKHTKRSKTGRFLLAVENRDCERNTHGSFGFQPLFSAFKRVFENSCLLGRHRKRPVKNRRDNDHF